MAILKQMRRILILTVLLSWGICIPQPSAFTAHATDLTFPEMYDGGSAYGLVLSGRLQSLEGQTVSVQGFMAPPLKPTINFFVLTEVPMSICPYCSSDADWPSNIIMVRLSKPVTALPFDEPIRVTGRLELGSQVDEETGFVSLVRIIAQSISRI